MEFEFNCEQVTKADKEGFAIFDSAKMGTLPKKSFEYMETLIDTMGKHSSKAQRLPTVITSFKRMQMNTDSQKLYIFSQKKKCLGYLKTGMKKLFVSTEYGQMKEINPLCVLDFYVSEEVQRQGVGKRLFDLMLEDAKTQPERIAYDRPSDKLLKFLSKHFGLKRYLPQNNNFVVFSQYFNSFGAAKTKTVDTKTEEKEEDTKSIYESKPSYKVTYSKGKKKDYDESNNIVSKDFISNLISSSHNSNQKVRRMAANEESKEGFSQMCDYDNVHERSKYYQSDVASTTTEIAGRTPLVDTTNGYLKTSYRNPILGDYQDHKSTTSTYGKADISMDDETKDPSGPELDKLIQQKEAELQQVMERLSVTSKESSRPEGQRRAPPRKSNLPVYQPPVAAAEKPQAVHGHPSLPGHGIDHNVYTASGMRRVQFHSKAPWATED